MAIFSWLRGQGSGSSGGVALSDINLTRGIPDNPFGVKYPSFDLSDYGVPGILRGPGEQITIEGGGVNRGAAILGGVLFLAGLYYAVKK